MNEILTIEIKKKNGFFSTKLTGRLHSRLVNENHSFNSFIEQIEAFILDEHGPFLEVNGFELKCRNLDIPEQIQFGKTLSSLFLVRGPK